MLLGEHVQAMATGENWLSAVTAFKAEGYDISHFLGSPWGGGIQQRRLRVFYWGTDSAGSGWFITANAASMQSVADGILASLLDGDVEVTAVDVFGPAEDIALVPSRYEQKQSFDLASGDMLDVDAKWPAGHAAWCRLECLRWPLLPGPFVMHAETFNTAFPALAALLARELNMACAVSILIWMVVVPSVDVLFSLSAHKH